MIFRDSLFIAYQENFFLLFVEWTLLGKSSVSISITIRTVSLVCIVALEGAPVQSVSMLPTDRTAVGRSAGCCRVAELPAGPALSWFW